MSRPPALLGLLVLCAAALAGCRRPAAQVARPAPVELDWPDAAAPIAAEPDAGPRGK